MRRSPANRIVGTGGLVLLAVAALAAPADAAVGGPDAAGYRWQDSDEPGIDTVVPPFLATDLRASGFSGDDTVLAIALPPAVFPSGFEFYGQRYAGLWLSSNGWLSLLDPFALSAPNPTRMPGPAFPNALVAFLWGDWTLEALPAPLAEAGPSLAGDSYVVHLRLAAKADPTRTAELHVVLWNNGCIKLIYAGVDLPAFTGGGVTEIGLESELGTVGISYMSASVALNGARFRSSYTVEFCPPSVIVFPLIGNSLRAVRKGSSIELLAEPGGGPATEFRLYRSPSPTLLAPVLEASAAEARFVDPLALADPAPRFYVLRAVDGLGNEHE